MINTPRARKLLSIRRDRRDMTKVGWEFVGEGGGRLWELNRGCRIGYEITEVKIAACGTGLWIKTQDQFSPTPPAEV